MTDTSGYQTGRPLKDSIRARVSEILDTWRRGSRPSARQVLEAHPELWSEPSAVLDLALAEFRLRRAAGEELSATQFAAAFSTYAEELRRILSVEQVLPPLDANVRWPEPGECFMEFELLKVLGIGAAGRVYLASQRTIGDRKVALKLTPFGYDEAHILGRLRHPNIVPVLSVHKDDDLRLFGVCMPYLGTATLQDVVRVAWRSDSAARRRVIPLLDAIARAAACPPDIEPPETLDSEIALWQMYTTYWDAVAYMAAELCEGLAYTHGKGILHHDLKPSNVLLSPKGRPMLLDFNLARGPTHSGRRMGGTVPYMSPEQFHSTFLEPKELGSANLGVKSDIYSLGALLFELCTGRLPHQAHADDFATYLELMTQSHLRGVPPVRDVNLRVPEKLAELIDWCLRTELKARPDSAEELRDGFRQLIVNRTRADLRRKQRRVALCAVAVVAATAGLGRWAAWWWQQGQSNPEFASPTNVARDGDRTASEPTLDRMIQAALQAERNGDFRRAADLFETIRKRDEAIVWREHLAYCLVRLGRITHARVQLAFLAAAEPDNAAYQNNLGYVLMRAEEFERAVPRLKRACELDPKLIQPYYNLACCYVRMPPVPPEAADYIERAIQLADEQTYWLHILAAQLYKLLRMQYDDPKYAAQFVHHRSEAVGLGCPGMVLQKFGLDDDGCDASNSRVAANVDHSVLETSPIRLRYCLPN